MGPDLCLAYQVVLQSVVDNVRQSTPNVGTMHHDSEGHRVLEVLLTKITVPPAADDHTVLPDSLPNLCSETPVAENNLP